MVMMVRRKGQQSGHVQTFSKHESSENIGHQGPRPSEIERARAVLKSYAILLFLVIRLRIDRGYGERMSSQATHADGCKDRSEINPVNLFPEKVWPSSPWNACSSAQAQASLVRKDTVPIIGTLKRKVFIVSFNLIHVKFIQLFSCRFWLVLDP